MICEPVILPCDGMGGPVPSLFTVWAEFAPAGLAGWTKYVSLQGTTVQQPGVLLGGNTHLPAGLPGHSYIGKICTGLSGLVTGEGLRPSYHYTGVQWSLFLHQQSGPMTFTGHWLCEPTQAEWAGCIEGLCDHCGWVRESWSWWLVLLLDRLEQHCWLRTHACLVLVPALLWRKQHWARSNKKVLWQSTYVSFIIRQKCQGFEFKMIYHCVFWIWIWKKRGKVKWQQTNLVPCICCWSCYLDQVTIIALCKEISQGSLSAKGSVAGCFQDLLFWD